MISTSTPTCTFSMLTLVSSPYSLVYADEIKARVTASNSLGYGSTSLTSTSNTFVKTVPGKPSSAPSSGSTTSTSLLEVSWNALNSPDNGGSTILSYHLVWDYGTGTTSYEVVGYSSYFTSTTTTLQSPSFTIVAGTSYKFKYRAYNLYGWGDYSDEVIIKAAAVPS